LIKDNYKRLELNMFGCSKGALLAAMPKAHPHVRNIPKDAQC